ncbi:hypothetical protein [Companilactobacillus zhachilii]|uniref:hypothetical protein n=1 Tax=Companilactobacillus zhachilii TaxID=2304606 RepID=UPI004034BBC4
MISSINGMKAGSNTKYHGHVRKPSILATTKMRVRMYKKPKPVRVVLLLLLFIYGSPN